MSIFDKDKKKKKVDPVFGNVGQKPPEMETIPEGPQEEPTPVFTAPAASPAPAKVDKPTKLDEDRPEELGILENRIEATDSKLAEIQAMLPEGKDAQSFYEGLAADAKRVYRDERNTLQWLQAADQLAQGLVQWAAANAGAGVIKPSRADLSQNFTALREDYRDEVKSIGGRSAKVQDTVKEAIALRERYAIARDRYKREKAAANTRAEERAADRTFRNEQAQIQRDHAKTLQDERIAAQGERQRKTREARADKQGGPDVVEARARRKQALQILSDLDSGAKVRGEKVDIGRAAPALIAAGVPEEKIEEYYEATGPGMSFGSSDDRERIRLEMAEILSGKVSDTEVAVSPEQAKPKFSATGPDGEKIFSMDGESWFDAEGNPFN